MTSRECEMTQPEAEDSHLIRVDAAGRSPLSSSPSKVVVGRAPSLRKSFCSCVGAFACLSIGIILLLYGSSEPSKPEGASGEAAASGLAGDGSSGSGSSSVPAPGRPCPDGSVASGDQCLLYFAEMSSWLSASASCRRWGGSLATIRSQAQNDLVLDLCDNKRCWIGLNDRKAEGDFRWISDEDDEGDDNARSNFRNWKSGAPDNVNDEDCVYMYGQLKPDNAGKWNDKACGSSYFYPFVCSRSSSVTGVASCSGYATQASCEPLGNAEEAALPDLPVCAAANGGIALSRFSIIGDMGLDDSGCESHVAGLVRQYERQFGDLDFVVGLGDLNYWEGKCESIHRNVGKHFGQLFKPGSCDGESYPSTPNGTRKNRLFPTLGNHDWWDHLELARMAELPYFQYLRNSPGSIGPMPSGLDPPVAVPPAPHFYRAKPLAGDLENEVELFSLNSNLIPFDQDGKATKYEAAYLDQKRWIAAALAESSARFKIVFFHHPPFSTRCVCRFDLQVQQLHALFPAQVLTTCFAPPLPITAFMTTLPLGWIFLLKVPA